MRCVLVNWIMASCSLVVKRMPTPAIMIKPQTCPQQLTPNRAFNVLPGANSRAESSALNRTLAAVRPTADIVRGEVGGGQVPRQPGQVRKEAAVTSPDLGRPSGLPYLGRFW